MVSEDEIRRRIDQRFDQFSLDELQAADSGALTLQSVFPELTLREREFGARYFNDKMDQLRAKLPVDQKPKVEQG